MQFLSTIEQKLVAFYRQFPHLPSTAREGIARNLWWLTLFFTIFFSLGVVMLVAGTFFAGTLATLLGVAVAGVPGLIAGAALTGVALVIVAIKLAVYIFTSVLLVLSIKPLKLHRKRGWNYLYYLALFSLAIGIIASLIDKSFNGLIVNLLFSILWGYFLFEIRPLFTAKK